MTAAALQERRAIFGGEDKIVIFYTEKARKRENNP